MPRSYLRPNSRCSPTPAVTTSIDRSYGALGIYANEHLISDQGPIREHYIGATPSDPTTFTATEICWPIFSTTPPPE